MRRLVPALFIGHGNPMNALSDNKYTKGWKSIAQEMKPPDAILAVSAHYYISSVKVTASLTPATIHDFIGFPQELYQISYPAPGSSELAGRIKTLLTPLHVEDDETWGIDHGVWVILRHMYPDADIPVVQLSMDKTKPPIFHYEIAKRLASLREENVLILSSGNLVHNLSSYRWHNGQSSPFEWADVFEKKVRNLLITNDHPSLLSYEEIGSDAILSVPSPDHYLPLIYLLGLCKEKERIDFPVEGFDGGSISMLCVRAQV